MKEKDINKKDKEKQRNDASFSKIVWAHWFFGAFKLDFLQLICKVSLIFKSKLDLPLSVILKGRELY